jgi:hypothetical protein
LYFLTDCLWFQLSGEDQLFRVLKK